MLRPSIKDLALLFLIGGAVINSCNSSLVAADVIQHGLDNMRLYAKIGHPCGASQTQIVKAELSD